MSLTRRSRSLRRPATSCWPGRLCTSCHWRCRAGATTPKPSAWPSKSLALLRVVGRKDLIGRALDRLALVLAFEGDYSTAEAHWRESLALSEEIGNQTGVASAAGGMGWTAWCAGGDLKQAQAHLEYALAIARRLGLRVFVSDFLGDLAVVALEQGAYARAEAYAREGLHIAREIDSVIFIGYNLGILGQIAALRQEFDAARRSLREALQIVASRELWPLVGRTVYIVADLFRLEARSPAAAIPVGQRGRRVPWSCWRRSRSTLRAGTCTCSAPGISSTRCCKICRPRRVQAPSLEGSNSTGRRAFARSWTSCCNPGPLPELEPCGGRAAPQRRRGRRNS